MKKYIIEKQNTDTETTDNYRRYKNKNKKFVVKKQDTTISETEPTTYTEDNEYYTETETNLEGGGKMYTNITKINYIRPQGGTRQDNLSRDDILKKLENYIPLKTMEEKAVIDRLPRFKTWIRYYNTETKRFRTGGLLARVSYPDYIMLVNTTKNLSWSVQLKDNIIYIPDPKYVERREEEKEKEFLIKEKLFTLYKQGRLAQK